jgi:hypothetical protein
MIRISFGLTCLVLSILCSVYAWVWCRKANPCVSKCAIQGPESGCHQIATDLSLRC